MASLPSPPPSPTMYNVLFTSLIPSRPVLYQTTSQVLRPDNCQSQDPLLKHTHLISAKPVEVYGNPSSEKVIRISNGGLGPTRILKVLCNAYLESKNLAKELRIEWIANHSRHSQIAMKAGVADIALTYERAEEELADMEGWSRTEGLICHDHFVLIGPREDPAGLGACSSQTLQQSFGRIAIEGIKGLSLASTGQSVKFHSRNDCSATNTKEKLLWDMAYISQLDRDHTTPQWYYKLPGTPLEALRQANKDRAYLLVDRATYLFARANGECEEMVCFNEGDEILLNSCAMLVRAGEERKVVLDLVDWLKGEEAQGLIERYGVEWSIGSPLFTKVDEPDVKESELLKKLYPLSPIHPPSQDLQSILTSTTLHTPLLTSSKSIPAVNVNDNPTNSARVMATKPSLGHLHFLEEYHKPLLAEDLLEDVMLWRQVYVRSPERIEV